MLSKKEAVKLRDTLNRLEKYFTGLREMNELPKALFVIDIGKEDICIAEARRMGIEIFAIVDTDCDPDKVTHSIPGNDDAVRSIRLITGRLANAALEVPVSAICWSYSRSVTRGTSESCPKRKR